MMNDSKLMFSEFELAMRVSLGEIHLTHVSKSAALMTRAFPY